MPESFICPECNMEVPMGRPHTRESCDSFKRANPSVAPKLKTGKLDWSVFPLQEAEEVVKVFVHGLDKYKAPFTYRNGTGIPEKDMLSATMRHIKEIQMGELIASDSGCLHWAHIAADALMAIAKINIEKRKQSVLDNLSSSIMGDDPTDEGYDFMDEVYLKNSDGSYSLQIPPDFDEVPMPPNPVIDHVHRTITFAKGISKEAKLKWFSQTTLIRGDGWKELTVPEMPNPTIDYVHRIIRFPKGTTQEQRSLWFSVNSKKAKFGWSVAGK